MDERLAKQIKRLAHDRRQSVSRFIADTLREALNGRVAKEQPPPFQLLTVGGGLREGIDLSNISELIIEDDLGALGKAGR